MPFKSLFGGSSKARASPTPSAVSQFSAAGDFQHPQYDQPPRVEKFEFLASPAPQYWGGYQAAPSATADNSALLTPDATQSVDPSSETTAPGAPSRSTDVGYSSPSLPTVPEASETTDSKPQKRFGWFGFGSTAVASKSPAGSTAPSQEEQQDNAQGQDQTATGEGVGNESPVRIEVQISSTPILDDETLFAKPPGITPADNNEADETGVNRSHSDKITKRLKPVPPPSDVVDPFGGLKSPGLVAPTRKPFEEPAAEVSTPDLSQEEDVSKRPTCSLNLVCYSRGCSISQIRVSARGKFETDEAFEEARRRNARLVTTDEELFESFRRAYLSEMCGFWRRYFSLKTLRRLRLLSYNDKTRPTAVPMDEFTMQEVLYAYNHPSEFGDETDWIEWVFRLRQPDKRHALEFVEGWNGTRIAVVGTIPCVASTLVGLIWSAKGGDIQTAFTVAGFILTVATVLLALLAVISGIDSKSH